METAGDRQGAEAPLQYFGTDGIRDLAGEGRLAPETLVRIGRALGRFARERRPDDGPTRIVLARDPRPSGTDIVARLTGAMAAEGAHVLDIGVAPTPALGWRVVDGGYDLGCMVSASHNPPEYNGIKPFVALSRKLSTDEERRVEALMTVVDGEAEAETPPLDVKACQEYVDRTARWLAARGDLAGTRLVVDLAAGATTSTAPALLQRLGAEVLCLHPADSRPINAECGSEHPEAWLGAVRREAPDAGLAFDGDGDRVILSTSEGEVLDGDDVLAILAEAARARGALAADCVVSTVMSNLGLEERLAELGARLERTPVGDRNVAERMRELGARIGGETSGHILLEREDVEAEEPVLIGDALVAAVRVLQSARELGRTLAALRAARPRYPQVLVGIPVRERRAIADWPALAREIETQERALQGTGRMVIRYSGTEPLLRVMAEGKDAALVEEAVRRVEAVAKAGP